MRNTFRLAMLILVTFLVGIMSGPGLANAGHISCEDTILVDTTLDSDVICDFTDSGRSGLVIGADGITLDLNGHTIGGAVEPSESHGGGAGIKVVDHSNITIKNGSITGFVMGVGLSGSDNNRIEDIVTTDNTFFGPG